MLRLDLLELDRLLEASQAPLRVFRNQLRATPRPFCQQSLRAIDWHSLIIETGAGDRLHDRTRARLERAAAERSRLGSSQFRHVSACEPELDQVLVRLRRVVTPYRDGFRRHACRAEAGHTCMIAIFPPARRVPVVLRSIEGVRTAMPLCDPVWNALLCYVLLLRLHPFADGNGRTMRALLSYELWRAGLMEPGVIPLKRVLDANRATELSRFVAISRAQEDPERLVDAVSAALVFMLRVLHVAVLHAGGTGQVAAEGTGQGTEERTERSRQASTATSGATPPALDG